MTSPGWRLRTAVLASAIPTVFALAALEPAAAAAPEGPSGAFCLTFSDEFDDAPGMSGPTRGLNPRKWNTGWYKLGIDQSSQPVQADEAQWYGPKGVVFPGDGAVHLKLTRHPNAAFGKTYRSGAINTASRYTVSPSQNRTVIEARIKVPGPNARAGGYWPAFWMLSNDNSPGGSGTYPPEIDIFEFFGGSRDPYSHLHTTGGDINKPFRITRGRVDLSLDYHIYTLDASTEAIALYLDGKLKWREPDKAIIARLLNADPMYMLLNMQFGGAAGAPTGAVPASMQVDYLRVWRLKPERRECPGGAAPAGDD